MLIKKQSGFSAIIAVFSMVILAGAVLGGIYYYSEIYKPAQYAKAIISLYGGVGEEFQRSNLQVDASTSFNDALKVLRKRQEFLSQTQDKFSKLSPPPKMKQIHQDFEQTLAWLITDHDEQEEIINFLKDVVDLQYNVNLEVILGTEPKPKTVAELKSKLNTHFSNAKIISKKLFRTEAPKLRGEITFSNLQTSWQDTEPQLDVLLTFLSSQDQNLSLDKLSPIVDKNSEVNEAIEKLKRFVELSNGFTDQNSLGYVFSSFSFLEERLPKELKDVTQRLSDALQGLKAQYPQ